MRTSKIFVTVDTVIFKKSGDSHSILFIKRKNEPFKNLWALPGGFVDENEDLETAAKRELLEETNINIEQLEQLGAYGKPFRDPRQHTVTIAYTGYVHEDIRAIAADDAKEAEWFIINNLPELAFDHNEIVKDALKKYNLL